MQNEPDRRPSITSGAIFRLALYYGIAGFGGGYSVLAQLRHELVEQRRWIEAEEFLVLAELSKSLPGTPATSLLALLGQRVGGVRGGVVAATAFLLPSMALMTAAGAAYSLMRGANALASFFDGMNAAMVGVVAATTVDLGRTALRGRWDVVAAIGAALALATRVTSEPLLAAGAIGVGVAMGARRAPPRSQVPDQEGAGNGLHAIALLPLLVGAGAGALAGLVRVFVPIGIATFGGGLAMVPAIEHTVVVEEHWLGPKTFADAVALGQITPGPIAICATFIGYRVGGLLGALIATIAMFGPAIALALVVGHSIERFRSSPLVQGALRALAPAVIGMLAAATWSLGRAGIAGWFDAGVGLVAFGVLARSKVSPLWLLVGGGLARVALSLIGHHG